MCSSVAVECFVKYATVFSMPAPTSAIFGMSYSKKHTLYILLLNSTHIASYSKQFDEERVKFRSNTRFNSARKTRVIQ